MKSPDRPAAHDNAAGRDESRAANAFTVGIVNVIVTTIIAAVQPVIMRYGAAHLDPMLYCAGSMTVAAAILAVVMWRKGELGALINRAWMPRLIALSMAGSVATSLALIFGLRRIDAVAGVILLQSEPLYSVMLAMIFLGERPAPRQMAATAAILLGIGSVYAGGRAFSPLYAAGLIFVTPLFWQVSHVISLGVMPPLSETCVTGARCIFAAIVLGAMLLIGDVRALAGLADPRALATILFTGGFVYVLGSLTWYGAIRRLSLAWTTAVVIPGVPMLSFGFAMLFLSERPSAREVAGIAVAVAGIIFLLFGADARRPARDAELVESIHPPLT
ncbi:MAG TPA: DMT family transporter [Candidatus Binataceae bacterium]|nr:DMT family transporter [Candidatus Binataceae bacterium]